MGDNTDPCMGSETLIILLAARHYQQLIGEHLLLSTIQFDQVLPLGTGMLNTVGIRFLPVSLFPLV